MALLHENGYRTDIKTTDVVKRFKNGETPYRIAKSYKVSQATIIYRLKQSGVYREKK